MPGNADCVQWTSSPERQARQSPQVIRGCTMTLSPSATLMTALPTECTQPAFSCPIVYGSATPDFSAHCPSRMCRSVRHTPAPPIFTMTSYGSTTVGAGTSVSSQVRW